MGTSKHALDLKKEELKKELARPENEISKFKVRRLQESIERHKKWDYQKSKKRRQKNWH